jgi:hypothetical protein
MLRADEPCRGRDDGRAREHARLGTPTHAEGRVTFAVHAMTVSSACTPATRAADNELYDRGCDLVEAATAIRRVADAPEAVRAVPAVLGCIEAAQRELLWAAAALEETSARTVEQRSGRTDSSANRRSERMQLGYANLQTALADAERASAAARSLAGRALAAARVV